MNACRHEVIKTSATGLKPERFQLIEHLIKSLISLDGLFGLGHAESQSKFREV